jgi:hypothetical protein
LAERSGAAQVLRTLIAAYGDLKDALAGGAVLAGICALLATADRAGALPVWTARSLMELHLAGHQSMASSPFIL